MTDELFDPLPGDAYLDRHGEPIPVDDEGYPLDIGPPAPGEGDDFENPELTMEC